MVERGLDRALEPWGCSAYLNSWCLLVSSACEKKKGGINDWKLDPKQYGTFSDEAVI